MIRKWAACLDEDCVLIGETDDFNVSVLMVVVTIPLPDATFDMDVSLVVDRPPGRMTTR
jgi:hypothetical protein